MSRTDLEELKQLLATLREAPPSKDAQEKALAAFERLLGGKQRQEQDRSPPGPERRR